MANCSKCGAVVEDHSLFCAECGHKLDNDTAPVEQSAGDLPQTMMTMGGLQTLDDLPTQDSSKSSAAVLQSGTLFADRYMIEEIIGHGGMGVVYRAIDKLSDKTVALKLIRPERLVGTNAIKKLIAEGITARDIRHQNIIAVYDVGDCRGQPFVSMEYLGGQSLRAWHRKKVQDREDVSLKTACRIIAETLKGLSAAHDAGVVHRDLKPENIVLTSDPTDDAAPLKILDFGIAGATGGAQNLSSGTGTGLGTPDYMAPEQKTNADSAGPSADLYSVSVMFYELLVDVIPQRHWQAPSGGRSDVPTAIDDLIEKGLSNRPANRPQSAKEYLSALEIAFSTAGYGTGLGNSRGQAGEFPLNKILKWSGIAVGGVAAVSIVAIIAASGDGPDVIDPCEGLFGEDRALCRGEIWNEPTRPPTETPGEVIPSPPPPPPPPPPPTLADLSGQWNDGMGTSYTMRVQNNGRFSGTGRSGDGMSFRLDGQFNGANGTFTVRSLDTGFAFNGLVEWRGDCHVSFETYDAYGQSIIAQGVMHVDHAPNAPCPARF